jgi:hypothetical protein
MIPAPYYPEGVPVDICTSFERLATRSAASASTDIPRTRSYIGCAMHMHVERGNRAFKANNNWTAPLARWFLKNHPEAAGFFELRERVDA